MTGVFDDLVAFIPVLVGRMDVLKNEQASFDLAVSRLGELIFINSNLLTLGIWIIRDEKLVAGSYFHRGFSQSNDVKKKRFSSAINLTSPQHISDYVISSGSPRFWTVYKKDEVLANDAYNTPNSELWLPLRKSNSIIGVLEMGSSGMVELPVGTEIEFFETHMQALQALLENIAKILNTTKD